MPPKAHQGAGGLCALPCSVPATSAVPLSVLGLGPSGLRGHQVWGCGMANPPSSFTTVCGYHHSGAISNKMTHLPCTPIPIAGEPSAPSAPQGVSPQGDPWDVGSTPVSGFAHRAGQTMAPQIYNPHSQHPACTLSGASLKGLAPHKLRGHIQPPALGGPSLSHSAWRAVSSRNPTVGHPASAAIPGLPPGQQSPAPPAPGVTENPALVVGAQVFMSGPWGTQARSCRGPMRCHHLGEQNQPTGNRSHPAPQKHSPARSPSLPSEGHRGAGAPSGCTRAFGPETCTPPSPSHIEWPPPDTSVPICPPLCSAVCFLLGVTSKAT